MKRILGFALAACAACGLSGGVQAQTYPSKPVQMFIHFNPGAVVDILGRVFADEIGQILRQQFVVVNREGASGIIAMTAVAQAKPDGYTLAFAPPGAIVSQLHLKKDLPYTIDSFVPVCQVFENQFVVLVSPGSPFKSLNQLMDYARANPNKLSYGVFGIGSVPDLQFQSLVLAAKAQITQVPYKSLAQMTSDTSSGQIDIGVTAFGSFGAAPVRVLATMAKQRNELFPDVPSAGELGFPVSDPAFGGLVAPKGTPPEILRTLETACAKAAEAPKWHDVLKRTGTPGPYLGSVEYAKRLRADYQAKGELIRLLGIKGD